MNRRLTRQSGFTVAELSVLGGIIGVISLILMQLLWNGTILFAKNSAINVAHQEARSAVMRIESDLHGCVSVPQLVDLSRNPVAGFGPAPGIAFHAYAAGPFKVVAGTYGANQNKITITGSGPPPAVNQRFNLPTHFIESYITALTQSGTTYTLTLDSNLANQVMTTMQAQAVNITCFTTDQVAYLVQSGELRQYPRRGSTTYKVLSTDVVSTAPFPPRRRPRGPLITGSSRPSTSPAPSIPPRSATFAPPTCTSTPWCPIAPV